MENEFAPTPWKNAPAYVVDAKGFPVAEVEFINDYERDEAIRNRIVACVNFCANIPNEQLEGTTLEEILKDYAMMRSYIETMGGAS